MNGTPRIVVLPGDGIGPEIVAAARELLDALGEFAYDERLMGGCSIDEHGTALTDEVLDVCCGADAVLLSDASVDVYNPKVVRSTAGSLFHLPIVVGVPLDELLTRVRAAGLRLLAADGAGQRLLPDVDLTGPHACVMGNEAWGLEPEVRDRCDEVVRVPIHGLAESLNLAMAATVCLYASAGTVHGGGARVPEVP